MSETARITRTVRLAGRFKKLGETVDVEVAADAGASIIRAAVARAVRGLGGDAWGGLVASSILTGERGVFAPDDIPAEGELLTILPPPCS